MPCQGWLAGRITASLSESRDVDVEKEIKLNARSVLQRRSEVRERSTNGSGARDPLRQQEMKSIVRRALLLLLHHFQFSLPDT